MARCLPYVMAGLVPAIHSTGHTPTGLAEKDARIKSGHDDVRKGAGQKERGPALFVRPRPCSAHTSASGERDPSVVSDTRVRDIPNESRLSHLIPLCPGESRLSHPIPLCPGESRLSRLIPLCPGESRLSRRIPLCPAESRRIPVNPAGNCARPSHGAAAGGATVLAGGGATMAVRRPEISRRRSHCW